MCGTQKLCIMCPFCANWVQTLLSVTIEFVSSTATLFLITRYSLTIFPNYCHQMKAKVIGYKKGFKAKIRMLKQFPGN